MDPTKSKSASLAKPATRKGRKPAGIEVSEVLGVATSLLADKSNPANPSNCVEASPSQFCVLAPAISDEPRDAGWAPRRGPQPVSSGEAIRRGTHLRLRVAGSPGDLLNGYDLETAKRWEAQATADLPDPIHSIGGELVPADTDRHSGSMRNTVADPSYITADASRSRVDLAFEAGVLETGLDAAETIEARNSLEKMMAHQMAAQHSSIMRLSAQLNRCIERMEAGQHHDETRERANVQGTRLAGAIARMSGSYQSGMTTMQRLRSGGTQRVIVQHVTVSEGGQAVVAGQVETGSPAPRGRSRRREGSASK
jgi:hypothetical protein